MDNQPEGGANAPKSSVELAKAAQAELQAQITDQRAALVDKLMEHRSVGGEDLTEESLLAIVRRHPNGIAYPFIQTVFPEVALTKARDALKAAGKIQQIGKKGNIILKPVGIA